MKTEELEKIGLSKEQIADVMKMNGTDIENLKKENETLTTERDNYQTQFETAKATLEGFEGKDFDAITKERDEWKQKAEQAERDFKKQIEARDYSDAVEKAADGLKFSSKSARKAFVAELLADPLKLKDGKLLGFDDYVEAYKKNDETAIVTEAEGEQAQFTGQMDAGNAGGITGDPNKMDFATYKQWRNQNK